MKKKKKNSIVGAAALVIAVACALIRSPQMQSITGVGHMGDTATTADSASSVASEADVSSLINSNMQNVLVVHKDIPYFKRSDMSKKTYIKLSQKDSLGRCGKAEMCTYYTGIASAERGDISAVHPSGWKQAFVKRNRKRYALYNRSHLLMYKLSRLNDNDRNLITGTEYFNQRLMLNVESEVLSYVRSSKEHVMYRVTPLYQGNELVARGVLMEAKSVESNHLKLCRYVPNVEPGVRVDYATGRAYSASPSVSVS